MWPAKLAKGQRVLQMKLGGLGKGEDSNGVHAADPESQAAAKH